MGFQHNIAFVAVVTIVILNLSTIDAAVRHAAVRHAAVRHAAVRHVSVSDPCKLTDYPELCTSHVKAVDVTGAIQQMIQATIDQTTQAKGFLNGMRSKNSMGENNLQDCRTNYDDAITDLQKSIVELKGKSIADLKNSLSSVVSYYNVCSDGFAENPDVPNPVAKVNALLLQLASNNLALADALKI